MYKGKERIKKAASFPAYLLMEERVCILFYRLPMSGQVVRYKEAPVTQFLSVWYAWSQWRNVRY